MKSMIKLILIISLLCVPLLSKSFASATPQDKEAQFLSQKNKNETTSETTSQSVNSSVQQKNNNPHHMRQLRFSALKASDAYGEIKALQEKDKVELQQQEEILIKLKSEKATFVTQCENYTDTQNKDKTEVDQVNNNITQLTEEKTTDESTSKKCVSKLTSQKKDLEECKTSIKVDAQKEEGLTDKQKEIKQKIKSADQYIDMFTEQLDKYKKEKIILETKLANSYADSTDNAKDVTQKTTTCNKKEEQVIETSKKCDEIMAKLIEAQIKINTEKKTQKNIITEKLKPATTETEKCTTKLVEKTYQIELVQAKITDIKLRICKYFDKKQLQVEKTALKQAADKKLLEEKPLEDEDIHNAGKVLSKEEQKKYDDVRMMTKAKIQGLKNIKKQ